MILLRELEEEMRRMTPRSPLYKLIKAEMERRGHWKRLPRGKSFVQGKDERRKRM